jgi:hypothetical protein
MGGGTGKIIMNIEFFFYYKFQKALELNPFFYDGPLFRGWMPNGVADGITIQSKEENIPITLYFKKHLAVDNRGIVTHTDHPPYLSEDLISYDNVLDAGPLYGAFEFSNVEEHIINVLKNDKRDNDDYLKLARRVNRICEPIVKNFINLMRSKYGNYWIDKPEQVSSRVRTPLRNEIEGISYYWKLGDSSDWIDLRPSGPIAITMNPHSESGYMSKDDWELLGKNGLGQATLAGEYLAQSIQLMQQGSLRHAVIDIVTAFEIAITQHLAKLDVTEKEVLVHAKDFARNQKLKQKIAVVASFLPLNDASILPGAIRCAEFRNQLAHAGEINDLALGGKPVRTLSSDGTIRDAIASLAEIVSYLLFGHGLRIINPNSGRGTKK